MPNLGKCTNAPQLENPLQVFSGEEGGRRDPNGCQGNGLNQGGPADGWLSGEERQRRLHNTGVLSKPGRGGGAGAIAHWLLFEDGKKKKKRKDGVPEARVPREGRAAWSQKSHKEGGVLEGAGTRLPLQGFQVSSLGLLWAWSWAQEAGWLHVLGENSFRRKRKKILVLLHTAKRGL